MFFFSRTPKKKSSPAKVFKATEHWEHPALGLVTVSYSQRAKRLSLGVRTSGEIRLTIPLCTTKQDALRFLNEKAVWAEQARKRIRNRHPQQIIQPPYSTREHTLHLEVGSVKSPNVKIGKGVIRVQYPAALSIESEEVQRTIKTGIEEAWRIEAKAYLPERTAYIYRETGFRYGKVTVRNTRSRWGSCSGNNDISLSLHLMKLPDHLIDYVILHELCHTHHKNHGPKFHALLNKVTGGRHETLRKELRKYSTRW